MNTDVDAAYVEDSQLLLFRTSPRDEVGRRGWARTAVLWLYEHDWLSFHPDEVREIDARQLAELAFLGSLVSAGCESSLLTRLLGDLRRPFSYEASEIYFDWETQSWKMLPVEDPIEPEAVFELWIDELAEQGDVDTLAERAERVEAARARAAEAAVESARGSRPLLVATFESVVVAKEVASVLKWEVSRIGDARETHVVVRDVRVYVQELPAKELSRFGTWRRLLGRDSEEEQDAGQ